jgi:hypothetical protein
MAVSFIGGGFKKIFASKEYAHTLEKATLNLDGKYLLGCIQYIIITL